MWGIVWGGAGDPCSVCVTQAHAQYYAGCCAPYFKGCSGIQQACFTNLAIVMSGRLQLFCRSNGLTAQPLPVPSDHLCVQMITKACVAFCRASLIMNRVSIASLGHGWLAVRDGVGGWRCGECAFLLLCSIH